MRLSALYQRKILCAWPAEYLRIFTSLYEFTRVIPIHSLQSESFLIGFRDHSQ
jgi:hypothetical protein